MSDPHRIVDEIRAFLQASDQSYKERHRDLALEYAEICVDVNRRLAQCAQLIKQGLRPEAIHLAEADPNLLAALAELDFAERAGWLDLVAIYDLPLPPDLDLATAEYLNVAYAEHDPLRNLLKKHRRLALARAPLRDRLAVLRELARLDPTNPIWSEDVQTYERARFKQVQAEAVDAVRNTDTEAIEALEQELTTDAWSLQPPGSLVQAVSQAAELERRQASKRALPAAETELNDAFSALDADWARQARSRWLSLAESAQLSADDPARERAEPALFWLDEQDKREASRREYEAVEARLTAALDDDQASRDQLDRLWHALVRLDQDVPEHLAQRYRSRVAAQDLSARRRARLLLVTGLTALVVLGITAVLIYRAMERGAAGRAAATAVAAALKSEKIDDVESLLKQFAANRPELIQSVEMAALMPEIDRARTNEADRGRRYHDLMAVAEAAPLTGSEPAPLAEARKLARTEVESRAVERLGNQIGRRNRDEAAQRDVEILPGLDAIAKALDAVESQPLGDPKRVQPVVEQLADASRTLSKILPDAGAVSETARTRVDQLRQRIATIRTEVDLATRRSRVADDLTAAVRRLPAGSEGYIRAAEGFAAAYEGTVQQTEVKNVISGSERDCWESALAWSRQARQWTDDPATLSPATARERVALCRRLLSSHPRSPDAGVINTYLKYLEPIAARDEPDGGLRARIIQILSSPSFDPLYMVRYKKSNADDRGRLRYYSAVSPSKSGTGTIALRYRVDADGNTRSQTLVENMIVGDRGLSPQTKLVREIKSTLESGEALASWEASMILAARKVADDPETDPICKLILLQAMLDTAAQGSHSFRDALGPTLKLLGRADEFRSVKWLDPLAEVDDQREAARQVIDRLPGWDGIAEKSRGGDAALRKSVADGPALVGWLTRRHPGWVVRFIDPKRTDGILVVALPEEDGGVWKTLGTQIDDAGAVVPVAPELAAEARLVFARRKDASSSSSETRSAGR